MGVHARLPPMTAPTPATAPAAATAPANAVRHLGRFQLLRLLGKSARTTQWLVTDPAVGEELVLVIPRQQPEDEAAMARWLAGARRAARVEHPGLLPPVDVGEQERWPYLAYARSAGALMSERLTREGLPAQEFVSAMVPALEGLAFAHEAGLAHLDLHAGMVMVSDGGGCRLIGLGAALSPANAPTGLMAQRALAERDVLVAGLLLHHGLAGRPALDEADLMQAATRLAPQGRELVRLPYTEVQTLAEPLRAIVNRASDRQPRQRYRNARTLARALSGWLRTTVDNGGGPLALLLDRLRVVGMLPAMPGAAQRTRSLLAMERQRIDDVATQVLADPALSFELLRAVNVAHRRVGAAVGNGPILTVRRAIEMLGLQGVRRAAGLLKPWPGPLSEGHAADLAHQMALARHAGQVAQWVRPPGYDAELVYLLALMQRLGRLVAQYHYPEEAAQIRRLMQPAPGSAPGEREEPGMNEQGAAYAVLGCDLDALGQAVGRHWGMDDAALHMMRRLPLDAPVHPSERDMDLLRMAASCGNEVVDARDEASHRRAHALQQVAQRYGRVLGLSLLEVQQCAQGIPPEERGTAAAGLVTRAGAL